MRVIVAGGRDFGDYALMRDELDVLLPAMGCTAMLSGMAPGADSLAVAYAEERRIPLTPYPANWRPNGVLDRSAGLKRNSLMARNAEGLIAFWDGRSRGTGHMVSEARRRGLIVRVVGY